MARLDGRQERRGAVEEAVRSAREARPSVGVRRSVVASVAEARPFVDRPSASVARRSDTVVGPYFGRPAGVPPAPQSESLFPGRVDTELQPTRRRFAADARARRTLRDDPARAARSRRDTRRPGRDGETPLSS